SRWMSVSAMGLPSDSGYRTSRGWLTLLMSEPHKTTSSSKGAMPSSYIFLQHIAKQRPLLDRVIEGDVRVRQIVVPALSHVPFYLRAIIHVQPRHSVGLDVERGERKRALAGEADQVPVDEEKIEAGGIGHENGRARQALHPGDVAPHCAFGCFEVLPRR